VKMAPVLALASSVTLLPALAGFGCATTDATGMGRFDVGVNVGVFPKVGVGVYAKLLDATSRIPQATTPGNEISAVEPVVLTHVPSHVEGCTNSRGCCKLFARGATGERANRVDRRWRLRQASRNNSTAPCRPRMAV
jgi:hypothetical protein